MPIPKPPADPDRVIAAGTVAAKGVAGDANALWRFERHRRANRLATPGPHPLRLVLDRLRPDVNVAKIFRSAEAFGVEAVHLVGIGPFDPAPAKGGFKHVPARFHEDFPACRELLAASGHTLVALEPDAPDALPEAPLPERCAFVLGHELDGLSEAVRSSDGLLRRRVPQWGRIDSLNVAVAAALAMYEWCRRYGRSG